MASDDRLVDALLRLSRLIRRSTHPVRRSEMTPEQYWLLKRLHRVGPMSVGALADELDLTSASVTVACKRLEKAGLLRRSRQPSAEDERVVIVSRTERGLEQLESWQEARRVFLGGLLAGLDEAEREQLLHLLDRVLSEGEGKAKAALGTESPPASEAQRQTARGRAEATEAREVSS